MMKRLFFAFGLTAILSAALAAGTNTTFYYSFPTFYGVITNVSSVYFFGDDGTPTTGAAAGIGLSVANTTNLESCIEITVASLSGGNPADIVIGTASDDLNLSCDFAASDVNKGSPTVSGYASAATNPTDGEVIVITNDPDSWQVTGSVSGTAPSFGDVLVAPAYVKNDGTLVYTGTERWVTLDTLAGQAFTNADAYTTNYNYVYVVPLVFKVAVSQLAAPTTGNFTVTWDAANL